MTRIDILERALEEFMKDKVLEELTEDEAEIVLDLQYEAMWERERYSYDKKL